MKITSLDKVMRFFLHVVLIWLTVSQTLRGSEPAVWEMALPGWDYRFPADHAVHRNFKTEWWYFTGNLMSEDGHAFGYELTFFRQGIIAPGQTGPVPDDATNTARSRFVRNDFKFAHFAISDLSDRKFTYTQQLSRGAFGEAGFGAAPPDSSPTTDNVPAERLAWMENWSLQPLADGSWRIEARTDKPRFMMIDLRVRPSKPLVIEGVNGVSQKAAGAGDASHYYSFTRLQTSGKLALGAESASRSVHGESWFDHEWASNQLAADQVGWDWFCFQFDDHTELMLYIMRRRDGSIDPASSGTLVGTGGETRHLQFSQFQLRPLKTWRSEKTTATYPIAWQVEIPSEGIELTVQPRLEDQELVLPAISYWEGSIEARGRRQGRELKGLGYMELTGYAAPLAGLRETAAAGPDLREGVH